MVEEPEPNTSPATVATTNASPVTPVAPPPVAVAARARLPAIAGPAVPLAIMPPAQPYGSSAMEKREKCEKNAILRPFLAGGQTDPHLSAESRVPNELLRFRSNRQDVLKEFEVDAGSPFDQMELKTIDDVQELASVLQNTHVPAHSTEAKQNVANGLPFARDRPSGVAAGYYHGGYAPPSTPGSAYQPYFSSAPQPQGIWPAQPHATAANQASWVGYNYAGGTYSSKASRNSFLFPSWQIPPSTQALHDNLVPPPITYYWTVTIILDHSYFIEILTSSKIAYSKVSGF